jgi:quercetin dioxygenase-like cupin family protein
MVTKARVIHEEETPWTTLGESKGFAEHPRSLSKLIAGPKSQGCKREKFDFLVSIFDPGGGVEPHSHEGTGTEHIFYILKGQGVVVLDGEKHAVKSGTTIWIPADAKHSLMNTSNEPLFMAVFSVPPE